MSEPPKTIQKHFNPSIASYHTALKSAICGQGVLNDASIKKEGERLRRLLWDNEDFWLDVKDTQQILNPLSSAIVAIEGNELNSRRCYKIVRETFSKSRAAVGASGFFDQIKDEIIDILQSREKFTKSDVAFLLDVLEPSDLGQALTNEDKQKAIELLAKKCLKNPVFAGKERQVMTEWAEWLAGTGKFEKPYVAMLGKQSIQWKRSRGIKLSFRIRSSPKSSKCFTTCQSQLRQQKGIGHSEAENHTKLRNSMKVHTVSQVTFIKQNLMLKYTAFLKKMRLEQQSEKIEEDRKPEFEKSIFDEECDMFACDFD